MVDVIDIPARKPGSDLVVKIFPLLFGKADDIVYLETAPIPHRILRLVFSHDRFRLPLETFSMLTGRVSGGDWKIVHTRPRTLVESRQFQQLNMGRATSIIHELSLRCWIAHLRDVDATSRIVLGLGPKYYSQQGNLVNPSLRHHSSRPSYEDSEVLALRWLT
jgi:hypothetical protein